MAFIAVIMYRHIVALTNGYIHRSRQRDGWL